MLMGPAALAVAAVVVLRAGINDPGPRGPTPFGFRGAVALGIGLDVRGTAPKGPIWPLPVSEAPLQAHLRIISDISEAGCDGHSPQSVCPGVEKATLRFHVSTLLDYRTPVLVAGERRAKVVSRGPNREEVRLPLALHQLSRGRHCLLASVTEDAGYVVDGQLPHHGNVSLFLLHVGGAQPNHCAPAAEARVEPWPLPASIGCGPPVLSVSRNRLVLRRSVGEGTPLWAFVPNCAKGPLRIVYSRNGVLQAGQDLLPPSTVPRRTDSHLRVRLPLLPEGTWQEVIVQEEGIPLATASQPVLISRLTVM